MPLSRPQHLSYIGEVILQMQPGSVLDVGSGFGMFGFLCRQYTDIWSGNYHDWTTKIHAIEIFPDYITELQQRIYDHIFIGNALDILPSLGKYDCIYAGDVLEHFSREDGLRLIELLKKHGKHVIIATPKIVSKQGAVFNNKHEAHISQWSEDDFKTCYVKYINNTMIVHIGTENQCYYCDGMKFYGDKVPMAKYSNIYSPTLFMGLYFQADYDVFAKHQGKRVVFWNGSDVSRLMQNQAWRMIILSNDAKHYCHNEQLQNELRSMGIKAEIQPIFFGYKKAYPITYRHFETPKVFICAHPGRELEYGIEIMQDVALQMQDIAFHVYGIDGENSANIVYHGHVDEGQMDMEIAGMQGCLRLNAHDGMSQVVCKSRLMGLYPIAALSPLNIKNELHRLKNQHTPLSYDSSGIMDLDNIHTLLKEDND